MLATPSPRCVARDTPERSASASALNAASTNVVVVLAAREPGAGRRASGAQACRRNAGRAWWGAAASAIAARRDSARFRRRGPRRSSVWTPRASSSGTLARRPRRRPSRPERPVEGCAEGDRAVLHRVVRVDPEVAGAGQLDVISGRNARAVSMWSRKPRPVRMFAGRGRRRVRVGYIVSGSRGGSARPPRALVAPAGLDSRQLGERPRGGLSLGVGDECGSNRGSADGRMCRRPGRARAAREEVGAGARARTSSRLGGAGARARMQPPGGRARPRPPHSSARPRPPTRRSRRAPPTTTRAIGC